jgi:hypothetical protein
MSKFGGGFVICNVCNTKCFANEGVDVDASTRVHRSCFRCAKCKTTLSKRFGKVGDHFYCEPHAAQLLSGEAEAAPAAAGAAGAAGASQPQPEIVNRTGGIELGGRLLFGIDAETALRRLETYDLALEMEIRAWVEGVLDRRLQGDTFADALHDGVALCQLANVLSPGAVPKINTKSTSAMFLTENIRLFLAACWKLGVPTGSLFNVGDLFNNGDMAAVLQTLLALGRIAQTLDGFNGPQLAAAKQNQGPGARKHQPVETGYLTKTYVQSAESADSQQLRTQLIKLEEQLKRERFQRAVLEEQAKSGSSASDAAEKLTQLRGELDAAEAKFVVAVNDARRLSEANATLAAELEWERTKEQRITKVDVHDVDDGDERTREELLEELANVEHAVKLLAQKRKTDVQKNRELAGRLESLEKLADLHAARVVQLENELRDARERAATSEARAAALLARLEELARPAATDDDDDDNDDDVVQEPADDHMADEQRVAEHHSAEVHAIIVALLGCGAQPSTAVDWERKPLVDAEDVLELAESFRTEAGRRVFINQLDDTLKGVELPRELPTRPFELFVQILGALLSEMSRAARVDTIGARIIMNASSELYRQTSDVADEPDFIEAHLRAHHIWTSKELWTQSFFQTLVAKLRESKSAGQRGDSHCKLPRSAAASVAGANSDDHDDGGDSDDDLPLDLELISNLLGVFASKMTRHRCPVDIVNAFVDDVCTQTGLDDDYRSSIHQKIAVKGSLAQLQVEREERKASRRRSRAESLLLPSLTLRRRRRAAAGDSSAVAASAPLRLSSGGSTKP